MDPLITVSQDHNKVYEMTNLYQKLLQGVNFFNVVEYVNTLNKLFRDSIIPHFEFEEKEIFPVALSKKNPSLDNIVSELLQEHRQITEKLARLNMVNKNIANNPNATQREKDGLLATCTALTRELANHSQKEDSELYPFLKDIIFKMK